MRGFIRLAAIISGVILVGCCALGAFALLNVTPTDRARWTAEAATQIVRQSWTATSIPSNTAPATIGPTPTPAPPTDTATAASTLAPKTATASARLTATAASPTAKIIPSPSPTSAPSGTPVSAGASSWLEDDGRVIGVREIAWNQSLGFTRAESGKTLISIYIIGINRSDHERSFNPFEFSIIDGGGEVSGKGIFADKEPVFNSCTVQPNGVCEGWWTTEIWDRPAVRAKLTLRWNPGLFSSTHETEITVPPNN
jgi:hypothetical protein